MDARNSGSLSDRGGAVIRITRPWFVRPLGATRSSVDLRRLATVCLTGCDASTPNVHLVNPLEAAGQNRVRPGLLALLSASLSEGHGGLRPGQTSGQPDSEPSDRTPTQAADLPPEPLLQEGDPHQTHVLPQLQRLHLGTDRLPV